MLVWKSDLWLLYSLSFVSYLLVEPKPTHQTAITPNSPAHDGVSLASLMRVATVPPFFMKNEANN
eukprot:992193-Amphidinium_carterae.1